MMPDESRFFANLGAPQRIWAISAINGEVERLVNIHQVIFEAFEPGDKLVYTGNYTCGNNANPIATLNELLFFRRELLSRDGITPDDLVYLRGVQEELWHKTLRILYAANPESIIQWIDGHYPMINSLLKAYGSSLNDAKRVAREGVMSMTRWTGFLKAQMRLHEGHDMFFTLLRRAAFTDDTTANDNGLLFVHAGIDTSRPVTAQSDSFWWGSAGFNALNKPYKPFKSIVRGYDPDAQGIHIGPVTVSLDGGGQQLICAQISNDGSILDMIAA